MKRIATCCAYCNCAIEISRWNFAISFTPTDIYCPICSACNNANKKSLFLASFAFITYVFIAAIAADMFFGAHDKTLGLAVGLLFSPIGLLFSAYAGALQPKLVKYERWWLRP